MLDSDKLRKRVILSMLTSPLVLAPFMLGSTLLAGAMAFTREAGMLVFGGFACMLGAAGAFASQWLLSTEKLASRAVEDMQRETVAEQAQRLDDLERRLVQDEDPRTESALRDLRSLDSVIRDRSVWAGELNAASMFEIVTKVQDLFDGCVKSLETSLGLWEAAHRLGTAGARCPILERREEIVCDVQTSIEHLSRVLVGMQRIGPSTAETSDLARVRAELDESLTVARRVEDKIRQWHEESATLE